METGSVTEAAAAPRVVRLHADDDVLVACTDVAAGTVLAGEGVTCREAIAAGHKVAARAVAAGQPVRRYGQVIGVATADIPAGAHVHEHNLAMSGNDRTHVIGADYRPTERAAEPATFQGIVRPDGRVATRNYIAVMATVNCSATVCRHIADAFRGEALADFPNVDGVVALGHQLGCGMGTKGRGLDLLRLTLGGYARHANFAGVLVIGLGCEGNQMDALFLSQGLEAHGQLRRLVIQDSGGTAATVAAGVAAVKDMLPAANAVRREPVPASALTVGLQCGGSDGYSGLTANPALGAAVDRLVRHGGTAILSETPEIYGAEHLLTRRAASEAVGRRLVEQVRWWEDYTERSGMQMNNNPSPGNRAGGLTTILEKSLGAVAKAGTTGLMAVYDYAEPVTEKGLVFMDTPGYDPVSATGQVAGGATLICFTTGRGSVFGCKPSPSIKLATNSRMYARMADDMDLNCGAIADGTLSVEEAGEQVFRLMLDVASGRPSRSEAHGFGSDEFAPWQREAII